VLSGRDPKVDLISRAPLFARCSRRELGEVAGIADEIDLPAGKTLMQQGMSAHEFFVLLEGSAEVVKDDEPIRTLHDGDFFGEIALISRSPRTATVRTTSPVRALVIRAQEFRALLDHSPRIQIRVLEALADRLAPETF
jgi:voltage-gated potassium channel